MHSLARGLAVFAIVIVGRRVAAEADIGCGLEVGVLHARGDGDLLGIGIYRLQRPALSRHFDHGRGHALTLKSFRPIACTDSHGVFTRRDDIAGVAGRFGWDRSYGTTAYMDAGEDLVGILMTQRLWDSASPPPAVDRRLETTGLESYGASILEAMERVGSNRDSDTVAAYK